MKLGLSMIYKDPAWFQHPSDTDSLMQVKAVKWFEKLSKSLVAEDLEEDFYLLNMIDNILMTDKDFPHVHELMAHICEVLNLETPPKIFMDTNPQATIRCLGDHNPMIVVSSGLLELLSKEELAAALAHEVGHIVCGHAYYKMLAENFEGVGAMANSLPGAGMALFGLKLPLYDWYRKADLSADRAAYLVMQDADPIMRMVSKIAGGSKEVAERISTASIEAQADEVDNIIRDMQEGGFKKKMSYYFSNLVMQGMMRSQPWPTIRIQEIKKWAQTSQAQDLLAGKEPQELPAEEEVKEGSGFFGYMGQTASEAWGAVKFWESGGEPEEQSEKVE